MKSKTTFFILLFIASITLIFYVLNRQMEAEKNRRLREQLEMEKSFNRMNEDLNRQLANSPVRDIILEDTLSQLSSLSVLVSHGPALIFRYSELNCSVCYETELFSLKNLFSTAHHRQVAIFSSYQDRRSFVMFKRGNRIDLPFYRIPQDAFDWILETYGMPYYFVLHPDLSVSHIYIPEKSLPEHNKRYLEQIQQLLNDSNKHF